MTAKGKEEEGETETDRELKSQGKRREEHRQKGGEKIYTAQFPKATLSFWLFVANAVPRTKNPFAFLIPSELLLNCWAQLIVNYTQQAPTITSTEENVHHMPDHKCLFPTGAAYLLSKNPFILFLMMLAPIF